MGHIQLFTLSSRLSKGEVGPQDKPREAGSEPGIPVQAPAGSWGEVQAGASHLHPTSFSGALRSLELLTHCPQQ